MVTFTYKATTSVSAIIISDQHCEGGFANGCYKGIFRGEFSGFLISIMGMPIN